jgi:hypothetical protein
MSDPKPPEHIQALAEAAKAVTGAGTPETASVVSKPPESTVRMLVWAGPAVSVLLVAVIAAIAGPAWLGLRSWPDSVAEARVNALAGLGIGLCIILAMVVFRLGSGGLKRVEARAGPGSIVVEGSD